jgi:signal transduction histidine kinase
VLHRFLRHNLRNKMTVIEGTAGHLADRLEDPAYREHVEQIRGAAAELMELSETAHTLSKVAVESDERYPVDAGRVLESVAATLRERYPGASITVAADGDGARVSADWRLEAVLEQLVENAVEHADREQPTVELSVTDGPDRVALRVADDGPGIPAEELTSITADGEPTQLTHGTGFGLWLVRSVVADYGGELTYDDRPGGGSVFTVRLGRAPDEPASGPAGETGEP